MPNTLSPVRFHFQTNCTLKDRRKLQHFVRKLVKLEKKQLRSLDYIFCTDNYLLQINQHFLQHDDYTDIITFELSNDELIEGEIYISVDRVKENALLHETAFNKELHRVIFHGVLHLCGYKDKSAPNKKIMTRMEDHYLAAYFG